MTTPNPLPACYLPSALRALDLGSGPCPATGYVGVDLFEQDGTEEEEEGSGFRVQGSSPELPASRFPLPASSGRVIFANLFDGSPWPFPDGSVERLRASHVIEHIPHDRVVIGSTSFKRVVKSPGRPSTTHYGTVPLTQNAFFWFFDEAYRIAAPGCRFELCWPHPQSDAIDQDPTHCRRPNVASLHYLSRQGRRAMAVHHYPVSCDWVAEPGSVRELGSEESLAPFMLTDGSLDILAAKRAHGAFHEIVAVLVKS